LVLDWVDGSLRSPVERSWDSNSLESSFLTDHFLWSFVSEELFVFFLSPGRHEVVPDGESVVLVSVDGLVFSISGSKDFGSEKVFFLGTVGETELSDVVEELGAGVNVFLADVLETKGNGSFAE